MSKTKFVLGKDLMLFVDGSAIALATSCKLSIKAETQDTSSKDSGIWADHIVTKLSFEGSSESVYASDIDAPNAHLVLTKKAIARERVGIAFGIVANPSDSGVPEDGWKIPESGYLKGFATIGSVEFNGSNGDKATMSVSFTGGGELEVIEPNAAPVNPASAPVAPIQTKSTPISEK